MLEMEHRSFSMDEVRNIKTNVTHGRLHASHSRCSGRRGSPSEQPRPVRGASVPHPVRFLTSCLSLGVGLRNFLGGETKRLAEQCRRNLSHLFPAVFGNRLDRNSPQGKNMVDGLFKRFFAYLAADASVPKRKAASENVLTGSSFATAGIWRPTL